MKIATYFTPLDSIGAENEIKLIDLWKKAWREAGFDPVVLSLYDAFKHPLFAQYREKVRTFPSVNPVGYDEQCWIRYAAVSATGETMMMADYDVFPTDIAKFNITESFTVWQDHGPCPCLVSGSPDEFTRIMRLFMEPGEFSSHDGNPHWSDMYAIQSLAGQYIQEDEVIEFNPTVDWKAKKAVHFPNGAMRKYGMKPKWKYVSGLLDGSVQIRWSEDGVEIEGL